MKRRWLWTVSIGMAMNLQERYRDGVIIRIQKSSTRLRIACPHAERHSHTLMGVLAFLEEPQQILVQSQLLNSWRSSQFKPVIGSNQRFFSGDHELGVRICESLLARSPLLLEIQAFNKISGEHYSCANLFSFSSRLSILSIPSKLGKMPFEVQSRKPSLEDSLSRSRVPPFARPDDAEVCKPLQFMGSSKQREHQTADHRQQ